MSDDEKYLRKMQRRMELRVKNKYTCPICFAVLCCKDKTQIDKHEKSEKHKSAISK